MNTNFTPAELQAFVAPFYPGNRLTIIPYAYSTVFTALAQNAQASNIITIAANADFFCLGINYRAQIGSAQTVSNKTEPFVRLLLLDSGSNEQFTNQAIDLSAYGTNGIGVQNLPFPRFVAGRSTITATVNNYAPTAETYTTLEIVLSGLLVRAYAQ